MMGCLGSMRNVVAAARNVELKLDGNREGLRIGLFSIV